MLDLGSCVRLTLGSGGPCQCGCGVGWIVQIEQVATVTRRAYIYHVRWADDDQMGRGITTHPAEDLIKVRFPDRSDPADVERWLASDEPAAL